jgi:hypothetical protein
VIQFFNRFFHLPLLDWHYGMPEILIEAISKMHLTADGGVARL